MLPTKYTSQYGNFSNVLALYQKRIAKQWEALNFSAEKGETAKV